ncbi:hypothetical protein AVEN_119944-1, partial [Araneus ventricosus]
SKLLVVQGTIIPTTLRNLWKYHFIASGSSRSEKAKSGPSEGPAVPLGELGSVVIEARDRILVLCPGLDSRIYKDFVLQKWYLITEYALNVGVHPCRAGFVSRR